MTGFDDQKKKARHWEIAVSCWARNERECYVLPTYDFAGTGDNKAPKILAPSSVVDKAKKDLVSPDLLMWSPKGIRWLEVKYKDRADPFRKTGILTTGINRRLWRHYCEVERLLGAPVWILFIHEKERECRADLISNLREYIDHEYGGWKMGPSGMVFWPYLKIPRWFGIEKIEAYLPEERLAA